MNLIVYLILLALSGLFVGALARLALPGKDPLTLFQTMLVGWVGSFGAGLLCLLFFGDEEYAGITLSILGATVVMYFVRRSRGGGFLDPGTPPPDK